MRILYVSQHEILEYDEVRLLTALGHQVFPLGYHHRPGPPIGHMRPRLDLGAEHLRLQQRFIELGCHYDVADPVRATVLAPEFIDEFDLTIVMMNPYFAHDFHPLLHRRPIILRTIGQGIGQWEGIHAVLRAAGVQLLRYAQTEANQADYAGADAVIRFYKDADDFPPWRGDVRAGLSFAAAFPTRYPAQFALWQQVAAALPMVLCGPGNDGVPQSLGAIRPEQQPKLLSRCRAYFYCSGLELPYTLNFMEAWMAGIPVVVMDPGAVGLHNPCPEIMQLATPGHDLLLARDVAEARLHLSRLLDDQAFGRAIGQAGRATAMRHFGRAPITAQWAEFLARTWAAA